MTQINLIFSGKQGIGKTSLATALTCSLVQQMPTGIIDLNNQNKDLWRILELQNYLERIDDSRGYLRKIVSDKEKKQLVLIKPVKPITTFSQTIDFIRLVTEKESSLESLVVESTAISLESLAEDTLQIDPPIPNLVIWILNRWSTSVQLDVLKTYYKMIDKLDKIADLVLVWNIDRVIEEPEGRKKINDIIRRYPEKLQRMEPVELPTEYILQAIDTLRKKGAINEKLGVVGTWVPFFRSMFFARDRGVPTNVFLIPYYKRLNLEQIVLSEPTSLKEIETLLGDFFLYVHNFRIARLKYLVKEV